MEDLSSSGDLADPLILKYRGNYPAFLRNVKKYLAFINQAYSANSQVSIYLEYVEDGFLFIYQSSAIFKSLERSVPIEVKTRCSHIFKKAKNFLLEGIENGEGFPLEKFVTIIESISHPASFVLPYIKEFHESMHPDIRVTCDEGKILLTIPHIEALQAYANLVFTIAIYHG